MLSISAFFCIFASNLFVSLIQFVLDIDPLPATPLAGIILAAAQTAFGAPQIFTLIIALFLLMVSGFISGSEIAFFSISNADIDDIDEDDHRGQDIKRMLGNPEKLLATILVTNNLVNVGIVVLTNFALGPVFSGMPEILSFILQSVLLTFLILLFGEIFPKLFASNYPMAWARHAMGGIKFFSWMFSPISGLLVHSTAIVNKVVTKSASISTDELSQALDITNVETNDDKQMLQDILKFGDTVASEIMTPRISMVGIDETCDFDEVMSIIIDKGYSRLPVYQDTMDNIKGVLYSRDMLPYIGKDNSGFNWHSLLRQPFFVPESRQIDNLLEDFRKLKIHMAIVVDEFGGTQGLVTLEDVLEEIVGDINDEYDEDNTYYTRISADTYNFDGRIPLTDFFRVTGLDEEDFTEVAEDAETLAGMILAIKGDFPKNKEPLSYGRCQFLVLEVADHRVQQVRVHIKSEN